MNKKNALAAFVIILLASIGINIYQLTLLAQQKRTNEVLQGEVRDYGNLYSPIYQYFTALSVEDFKNKVAKGEHFTVYIGRPDCGDCNSFEPGFEEMIKEHQMANKLYYLNVKWLRESDPTGEWERFKQTYGFTQTPAFSTYENGKQTSMIEWSDKGLPKSELEAWLKSQGIL